MTECDSLNASQVDLETRIVDGVYLASTGRTPTTVHENSERALSLPDLDYDQPLELMSKWAEANNFGPRMDRTISLGSHREDLMVMLTWAEDKKRKIMHARQLQQLRREKSLQRRLNVTIDPSVLDPLVSVGSAEQLMALADICPGHTGSMSARTSDPDTSESLSNSRTEARTRESAMKSMAADSNPKLLDKSSQPDVKEQEEDTKENLPPTKDSTPRQPLSSPRQRSHEVPVEISAKKMTQERVRSHSVSRSQSPARKSQSRSSQPSRQSPRQALATPHQSPLQSRRSLAPANTKSLSRQSTPSRPRAISTPRSNGGLAAPEPKQSSRRSVGAKPFAVSPSRKSTSAIPAARPSSTARTSTQPLQVPSSRASNARTTNPISGKSNPKAVNGNSRSTPHAGPRGAKASLKDRKAALPKPKPSPPHPKLESNAVPMLPKFKAAQIQTIIKDIMEEFSAVFDPEIMVEWANHLAAYVVTELTELQQPFKYIVHVLTLPPEATGFLMKSGCLWEDGLDGTITVRFDTDFFQHYVTVFGLAL